MLDFTLTEEQEMVRKMVRDFALKEIAPHARENDEKQQFDTSLIPKMADLGLLGAPIPQKYGGAGMDYICFGLICEALEYADSSARTIVSVHIGLNSLTLYTWGSEEQKQRFLVPQARGEKIGCFALTEPNAGSDVLGMQATARRDGDHYVLNGEKMWISLGDVADHFLVFAYTDREKKARGVSAFVVERGTPGLSTSPIHGKMGLRASDAASVWWKVGWMKNNGIPHTREASLAKWYATEGAVRAAHNAIQVHGGYGYSNEYPVERFFRNARAQILYEGTSQIHTLMQADFALGYRTYKAPRCTLPPYRPGE